MDFWKAIEPPLRAASEEKQPPPRTQAVGALRRDRARRERVAHPRRAQRRLGRADPRHQPRAAPAPSRRRCTAAAAPSTFDRRPRLRRPIASSEAQAVEPRGMDVDGPHHAARAELDPRRRLPCRPAMPPSRSRAAGSCAGSAAPGCPRRCPLTSRAHRSAASAGSPTAASSSSARAASSGASRRTASANLWRVPDTEITFLGALRRQLGHDHARRRAPLPRRRRALRARHDRGRRRAVLRRSRHRRERRHQHAPGSAPSRASRRGCSSRAATGAPSSASSSASSSTSGRSAAGTSRASLPRPTAARSPSASADMRSRSSPEARGASSRPCRRRAISCRSTTTDGRSGLGRLGAGAPAAPHEHGHARWVRMSGRHRRDLEHDRDLGGGPIRSRDRRRRSGGRGTARVVQPLSRRLDVVRIRRYRSHPPETAAAHVALPEDPASPITAARSRSLPRRRGRGGAPARRSTAGRMVRGRVLAAVGPRALPRSRAQRRRGLASSVVADVARRPAVLLALVRVRLLPRAFGRLLSRRAARRSRARRADRSVAGLLLVDVCERARRRAATAARSAAGSSSRGASTSRCAASTARFDGYTIAQLSDLHIGAFHPLWWAQALGARRERRRRRRGRRHRRHGDERRRLPRGHRRARRRPSRQGRRLRHHGQPRLLRRRRAARLAPARARRARAPQPRASCSSATARSSSSPASTTRGRSARTSTPRSRSGPRASRPSCSRTIPIASRRRPRATSTSSSAATRTAVRSRCPFLGRFVNASKLAHEFHIGLYKEGDSTLYVHGGLGTTGPPVRLGVAPSIALIRLRAA